MYPNLWEVWNPSTLNILVPLILRRNEGHASLLVFPGRNVSLKETLEENRVTNVHMSISLAELNDIGDELG